MTFNLDDPAAMRVISVAKGDRSAIADAEAMFRGAVRAAMEAGGCRNVVVGVHVEGDACDHEVGP